MSKYDDAKTQILINTFENRYNTEQFEGFIVQFFNSIEWIRKKQIQNEYDSDYYYIAEYTHISNYNIDIRTRVAIFSVKLKDGKNIERARTMQRNFAAKLLRASNGKFDTAIIAFYADNEPRWKLSFVKLDYDFVAGKENEYLTPAKRYSYIVGKGEPCHTAKDRILPIFMAEDFNPSIKSIEEAFSVETVTKKFFDEYKSKYSDLYDRLNENSAFMIESERYDFTTEQFAKKLLGQLSFLYFLQKKGWLGVSVVPSPKTIITQKEFNNAFYKLRQASKVVMPKVFDAFEGGYRLDYDKLQKLNNSEADILYRCFRLLDNTLNAKKQQWGQGNKNFIRSLFSKCMELKGNFYDDFLEPLFYEALNNNNRGENFYYKRFNCRIPFLNGGLFKPLKNYNWEYEEFEIHNDFFSNEMETGILDIFDRYNFTMCEDEPLEREVAVDPEMLGKIFENLLDVNDRKSKGAFYTPREIVHYMCQESLINYLENKTNISYGDMKNFVLFGESMKVSGKPVPAIILENICKIDDALLNIKVADPAVGSGAFPLGMLSEIVKLRSTLTPLIIDSKLPIGKEMSEAQKKQIMSLRAKEHEKRNIYDLKLQIIKNSIFAVDIEPSAVDIAKLRLWLSLVVDESLEPTFEELQFGESKQADPRPLPNLDYNIMCGNSLVDEFEGIKFSDDKFLDLNKPVSRNTQMSMEGIENIVNDLLEDLFKKQEELFTEQNEEKNNKLLKAIEKDIDEIIRTKLSLENNVSGLAKYEDSLKRKTKPYFLWKLYFGKVFRDNGGFDVVIGNPPYVRADSNSIHLELRKAIENSNYFETLWEKWDLFIPFMEKGFKLLRENGVTTMIVSDAYCHAKYAKKSQEWFLQNSRILHLDFLGQITIFEAAVRNIICFFQKSEHKDNHPKRCVHKNQFGNTTLLPTDEQSNLTYRAFFPEDTICSNFVKDTIKLNEICYISYGLRPNSDENEAKGEFKTSDLVTETKDEIHCKPYVEGKHLGAWLPVRNIWIEWGTERAPKKFCRPTFPEMYQVGEKILAPRSPGANPVACYDNSYLIFTPASVGFIQWHFLTGVQNNSLKKNARYKTEPQKMDLPKREVLENTSKQFEIKYLLAVMNSSVAQNYIRANRRSNVHVYPDDWKQLPIPIASAEQQTRIISLVNQIITIKQSSSMEDISTIEVEIDKMVCGLYGLTAEEIKIVEGV